MASHPLSGPAGWLPVSLDYAQRDRFIARISRELLQRRARKLGRCPVCGRDVAIGDDFMSVDGAVSHVDCAERGERTI